MASIGVDGGGDIPGWTKEPNESTKARQPPTKTTQDRSMASTAGYLRQRSEPLATRAPALPLKVLFMQSSITVDSSRRLTPWAPWP